MSDWQPIEIAPKDGSYILLYWPSYSYDLADGAGVPNIDIGFWKQNRRLAGCPDERLQEFYFANTDELDDYGLAVKGKGPSHWMIIPKPPEAK